MKMIFRNKTPTGSEVASDLRNPADWFLNLFNNRGNNVTEESAISTSEVYSSVKVLADDLAKYPLNLLYDNKGTVEKAKKHSVYSLLKDKPNKNMTSFEWKHLVMTQLNLWGNSYHYLEIGRNGQVKEIVPLDPRVTSVLYHAETNSVTYRTIYKGKQVTLNSDELLHFKNLSINGLIGRSPVQVLRESIQGNQKGREMASNLFKREGIPLAILKATRIPLTAENKEIVAESWKKHLENNNVAILNPDLDYQSVGIPQSDAQFIQTMKYNKAEIASIFKVPPYKYGDYSGLTHSNALSQSMDYVKNVMLPYVTNIEAELNTKILTDLDRKRGYYFKFNMEAELRADQKSRAEFYEKMQHVGVYTINDILRSEDMSTIDNEYGDMRFMSLNYAPIDTIKEYQMWKAGARGNEQLEDESLK
ncbi:phage portal protein [uncultured Gemella sp.]|uniref:phage portal protein n=1 Tax=uncultured Gemella sp. TaxID=254352 RepID=UPI0028D4B737|nr:phage portal protein [uncultured Gemella sp.]